MTTVSINPSLFIGPILAVVGILVIAMILGGAIYRYRRR